MTLFSPQFNRGTSHESRRIPRAFFLCVWLTVLTAAGTGISSDYCAYDFPLDSNPTPISSDDICNFHQVDALLYRGGRPRPSAYPKLAEVGIRTIINLEEQEAAEAEKTAIDRLNKGLPRNRQIQVISFPIGPAEIETKGVSHERLKMLFELIHDAKKPIFLHCYHGKDRTGAVVAIYRMLMNQKSFSEAFDEAYHYGFIPEDHGLSRTVDRYMSEKRLRALPHPKPAK